MVDRGCSELEAQHQQLRLEQKLLVATHAVLAHLCAPPPPPARDTVAMEVEAETEAARVCDPEEIRTCTSVEQQLARVELPPPTVTLLQLTAWVHGGHVLVRAVVRVSELPPPTVANRNSRVVIFRRPPNPSTTIVARTDATTVQLVHARHKRAGAVHRPSARAKPHSSNSHQAHHSVY
jgi:hypothetical protein